MTKRFHTPATKFLIGYKAVSAILLFCFTLVLLFTWRRYEILSDYADEAHGRALTIVLSRALNMQPNRLEFGSIATFLYGMLAGVEAVGLWLHKTWAEGLVLVTVALSLPIEIFELAHHMTGIKWMIFMINIVIFWYVLKQFRANIAKHN
jgi:uncharacterized membrane protein (DUF2068 family)